MMMASGWHELTGYDREKGREVHRGWCLAEDDRLWIVESGVGGYALGYVFLVRHEGQVTVPVTKYPTLREAQTSPWLGGEWPVLTSLETLRAVRGGATMRRMVETDWLGMFGEGRADAPPA